MNITEATINQNFSVVHPLFDKPEKKLNPESVGQMKMTKSVRYSLMVLRLYLICMIVVAFYRTFVIAGILH